MDEITYPCPNRSWSLLVTTYLLIGDLSKFITEWPPLTYALSPKYESYILSSVDVLRHITLIWL